MPHFTYFVMACPTCGRRLHVHVEHLGKKVACQHCQGQFTACDQASRRRDGAQPAQSILGRANDLLRHAAEKAGRARHAHPK